MSDLHQLVENLSHLTVMEAAELSRMLEKRWGVSAAAPVAVPVEATAPVVAEPEQTEFALHLAGFQGDKKVAVIKEVRAITGLGLKEAKDFTEQASPANEKVLKDGLTSADAQTLKTKMEEVGAIITIH